MRELTLTETEIVFGADTYDAYAGCPSCSGYDLCAGYGCDPAAYAASQIPTSEDEQAYWDWWAAEYVARNYAYDTRYMTGSGLSSIGNGGEAAFKDAINSFLEFVPSGSGANQCYAYSFEWDISEGALYVINAANERLKVASGYSGALGAVNDPNQMWTKDVGPIPQGWYTIGNSSEQVAATQNRQPIGPEHMYLDPESSNHMGNRSMFYIHGDSLANPGTASTGCIILPLAVRDAIDDYRDAGVITELHVAP